MVWQVTFSRKAEKQLKKLSRKERDLLGALVMDLRVGGPEQPRWPNYSKLSKTTYHCHLSYKWVACWYVKDGELKLIEIYYAGSRENAPY